MGSSSVKLASGSLGAGTEPRNKLEAESFA
jgi:hypothetical protein